MFIVYHKNFQKKVSKLQEGKLKSLKEKLIIFKKNPFDEKLNNHPLHGKFSDCRSINITGDLRLIYKKLDDSSFLFIEIDAHSNLY